MNDNSYEITNSTVAAEDNGSEVIEEISEAVKETVISEIESADMTVQESEETQKIQVNQTSEVNQESNESDEPDMMAGTEESVESIGKNGKTAKKKHFCEFLPLSLYVLLLQLC